MRFVGIRRLVGKAEFRRRGLPSVWSLAAPTRSWDQAERLERRVAAAAVPSDRGSNKGLRERTRPGDCSEHALLSDRCSKGNGFAAHKGKGPARGQPLPFEITFDPARTSR